jgi:hypothetical protein
MNDGLDYKRLCCKNSLIIQDVAVRICSFLLWSAAKIFFATEPGGIPRWIYLKSPKNTPSIAVGLDGDEFDIVGASPMIN